MIADTQTHSRSRRWLLVGIAAAAAAAILVWFLWAQRGRGGGERQAAPTGDRMAGLQGTGGMDRMPGMQMSPGGSVHLTSDQIRQFGITFGTVDQRTLENAVRTVGTVTVDETRLAQVAPKFGGFVERLHVERTGQPVRRGQPLMDVYSPELLAAQQELLVARNLQRTMGESAMPGAPSTPTDLMAAARRRLALAGVSEARIEQVLRSGEPQRALTLFSPASGVVTEKNVIQGQSIQAGQTLYTIANLDEVWLEAELRGPDAAGVRVGSAASIEVEGLAGRTFTGRVEYIYPTVDTASRTVTARVAVGNFDGLLKPGTYATVRFSTPTRSALTVPTSAVVRTGERAVVFVDMGGGQLMPHEVELGRVAGDYTEVRTGVEPGQRVVTSAHFLLDSESNLAEVMRSMMGQMGSAGGPRSGQTGNMEGMDMPGMKMPRERR